MSDADYPIALHASLDPTDWDDYRLQAHGMLDDMVDFMAGLRERPVWQPMSQQVRRQLNTPLPHEPAELAEVYGEFQQCIQPYIPGNIHPRFLGWVQGGGNPVGVLADLLAATLNANLGGRDHAPVEVERQVIRWAAEMIGLPAGSSGALVTGASMANMTALLVARAGALGGAVRQQGIAGRRLVAYTSPATHHCVSRALDMMGLGTDALRLIPTDSAHRIDLAALAERVRRDRAAGDQPFAVIGSAGTVDTGAVDDLAGLARYCREQSLWFHVDAALGGVAMLSPFHRHKLLGIAEADSVAFDWHKWGQVPYDAGCVLVRDAELHRATFATNPNYLARETRGLAAGHPWPTDFGPDLSRGFRALKVWMTIKTYGADRLGRVVDHCCELAQQLTARVEREAELELLSPTVLNIVCFRYLGQGDLDWLNSEIVIALQESGVAVPSTTRVDGVIAIRCAFVNHRTTEQDLQITVDAVLDAGRRLGGLAKKFA
jgi:glutamate/tyrosine decarboxylase-like PLP-dependent enzyme